MSDDNNNDTMMCCASCGIAEIDDIKLTQCDACDLVRYCCDDCKQIHKSQHEEACKKRAAELRDKLLFKQPESTHHGDCPICMLPLPNDPKISTVYSCCSKVICNGCEYANSVRETEERLQPACPFCREPTPKTREQSDKQKMKRIEANDPVAMLVVGVEQYCGGNYGRAFEWYTKAAKFGCVEAHYKLATMYMLGHGVEKDKGKEIHHFEEAAIGGHPDARFFLGKNELDNRDYERAAKHYIIAAGQGDDDSIQMLMNVFKAGYVSKEDLATALRAHQAAVDATKSPQRETAPRIE